MQAIEGEIEAGTVAVAVSGLSKRYGNATALEGVALRVPEGAVYLLLGMNGAGKSTLLKLLINLERPDAGTASVFGLDCTRGDEVRARIGYLPERHEPGSAWMTCQRLLRHLAVYYPAWDHEYAARLVQELELQPQRKIAGLSKGETRRLQLVMALAHRPPLLLLDEPTDGLDPVIRKRALALLAGHLADTPTTVLLTTHHAQEVESLVDHVGILHRGRLVAELSSAELQRTVRRYQVRIPEGWSLPAGLRTFSARRSAGGREAQFTLMGDEGAMTGQLTAAGAVVHTVRSLTLEEAALALLPDEGAA